MKYKKIALIGMMGSGKSTISKLLAEKVNIKALDCDEIFVQNFGNIKDYFAQFGEKSFREKETEILFQVSKKDSFILSCGGGIISSEINRSILFNQDIFTIYLETSPKEIYKRVRDDKERPLLETSDKLKSIRDILLEREKYYSMADITISTDLKDPDSIVREIMNIMENKVKITFSGIKTSEITIQNGITDDFDDLFEDKNYFLITNTTLAKLYPKFVSKFFKNNVIVIKDGEKYKNFKTLEFIVNSLLSKKIERKDCIVAFGGGVVGDIAAFAASTVLRGVELIQVPTTLLAMCDSAIGGKTGFNTKFGKNMVGSFYLADKVFIDSKFLNTLNRYEFKCGMGEIIKYALIEKSCKSLQNYDLLNFIKDSDGEFIMENIDRIIEACVNLKANVVNLDNKESGLRKILNFGHTFAHAFETITNYKEFSHGEAVSYGIRYASKLSYNLGKINADYLIMINQLLDNHKLAHKKLSFPSKKVIELMGNDKKVTDRKINLLLPVDFATVELFDNIDLPSIEACLL